MERVRKVVGPVVLVLVALAVLVATLSYGGGAAAPRLADPGALVRWGLPVATLVTILSAALALGALVLCAFVFAPDRPEYEHAFDVAATGSGILTVASAGTGFLTFLSVSGLRPSLDDSFGEALGGFITTVPLGEAWLVMTLLAAAATVLCFVARAHVFALVTAGVVAAALLPIAAQGHAAGAAGHDQAVAGLSLHMIFAAAWLGGLLTLVLVRPRIAVGRMAAVVARYSSIALVCFVVVAVSGYVSAELRVGTLARLATPYGVIVLVKVAALVAIGLFGLAYRRGVIRMLERGRTVFWRLVVGEFGFLGVAWGAAVALSRTPSPVPDEPIPATTPALILTGEPLPGPLTLAGAAAHWRIDVLWLLVCAFALFFYLAGVVRVRRRGRPWPVARVVSFVFGVLVLFAALDGPGSVYERILVSQYLLVSMLVLTVVAPLVVAARPLELASRACVPRADGSRGFADWFAALAASRSSRVLAHPLTAAVLLAGALWAVVYTDLLRASLENRGVRDLAVAGLLAVGCLAASSLAGVGARPPRVGPGLGVGLLAAAGAAMALTGVALAHGEGLVLPHWFGATGRTWGAGPLEDQTVGAVVVWVVGCGGVLVMVAATVVASVRSRLSPRRS